MQINFFRLIFILSLLALGQLSAETIRGTLFKNSGGVIQLKSLEGGGEKFRTIKIDPKFQYTLDEKLVNSPNNVLQFSGTITEDTIRAERTPTIVGDLVILRGLLGRGERGELFLDNQSAIFGRTKPIYGIPFDQASRDYYIDKEVITHGHFETIQGERVFVINAILQDQLLSAALNGPFTPPPEFIENPTKFVLKQMPLNENSQALNAWRGVLSQNSQQAVLVGEAVLIVALSGRQGDNPGAAGGHITIGMGEVQADLSIQGEVFNFYFAGEKEVLAGNTDLTNYFGHLIQGQLNYRPTYTLLAYGLEHHKLQQVRDLLEQDLHRVRTEKGLKVTPGYNCTTTLNAALKSINIKGKHENFLKKKLRLRNLAYLLPFSWNSSKSKGVSTWQKAQYLGYILSHPPEQYLPRAAFESFVKQFKSKRWRKKRGITRVDYLFMPQTPSARQLGGIPTNRAFETKRVMSYYHKREEGLEVIEQAQKILLNPDDYSKEEFFRAQTIVDQDQSEVKEQLDKID